MDTLQYDLMLEALRTVFLICLPIVLGVALTGLLASALQSVTGTADPASLYALRLIVLVLIVYLLFSTMSDSIINLARMALT